MDYWQTYAPVCSLRTLRLMMAIAAHGGLELRQFDVRNAYLQSDLSEEVYVRPPPG